MSIAQWAAIAAIVVWGFVSAALFLRKPSERQHRRGAWAALCMALLCVLCVSIGLWGPHAGEQNDEPGSWHTAPLKP